MTGYDVSIVKTLDGIVASWMIAAPTSIPNPNMIRWSILQPAAEQNVAATANYGAPSKFLNIDGSSIAFNCAKRLCVLDRSKPAQTISLVSTEENSEGISSAWIVINRVRYLVAGYKGQLSMFRP
jgi:hypothetical protein